MKKEPGPPNFDWWYKVIVDVMGVPQLQDANKVWLPILSNQITLAVF